MFFEKEKQNSGGRPPITTIAQSLFHWEEIEDLRDLERFRLVLDWMPDEALMVKLERERGKGRDDYPIRAMWNSLLAGVVFQHSSKAQLLREDGLLWEKVVKCFGDKGYDDGKLLKELWDEYGIKPVIDIRNCWKQPDGQDTKVLPGTTNAVYDYEGNVFCHCPCTGEVRAMALGRVKEKEKLRSLLQAA